MPWCEDCARFYTPSTLTPEGDCPGGHHVADPGARPAVVQSTAPGPPAGEERVRAPWHFWLLVAAVVIYLGWRVVQGVDWLLG